MSGYPSGVTGNEYEISGPAAEWDAAQPEPCEECKAPRRITTPHGQRERRQVIWQAHPDRGEWWICAVCGAANETVDERSER